jgi:hypothetical protein
MSDFPESVQAEVKRLPDMQKEIGQRKKA